jgi:hypothetical protein
MARHTIDDVFIVNGTNKAILTESELGEQWIPKSAIHDDSEIWEPGDSGTLTIHGWFAERKGWI